jgi:hypothetical protein
MAPHQTFYLKADRSLLNPHESADWVTSLEKATVFGSNQGQGRALLLHDGVAR